MFLNGFFEKEGKKGSFRKAKRGRQKGEGKKGSFRKEGKKGSFRNVLNKFLISSITLLFGKAKRGHFVMF
jgi:hypothetical protein